ncbi:translation initiation factor IF-2-like [Manduca sexta]|uniref:translation initiation factor IF-2-like n=1 Tax=Manduca sexta TaxID=7130 RepID=UPI00189090CC|nr:translation initiation factor IF-2-like [Manduca sexta]
MPAPPGAHGARSTAPVPVGSSGRARARSCNVHNAPAAARGRHLATVAHADRPGSSRGDTRSRGTRQTTGRRRRRVRHPSRRAPPNGAPRGAPSPAGTRRGPRASGGRAAAPPSVVFRRGRGVRRRHTSRAARAGGRGARGASGARLIWLMRRAGATLAPAAAAASAAAPAASF